MSECGSDTGDDEIRRSIERRIISGALCLALYGALALSLGVFLGRFTAPAPWAQNGVLGVQPFDVASATIQLIQTGRDTVDRLTPKEPLLFEPDFPFSGPVVSITSAKPAPGTHPIVGFGGAFTDASALVFQKLRAEEQQLVLEGYFGPEGLGYTLGRTHINSCDFSTENYAFAKVDNDFELKHFDNDVTRSKQLLIPFINVAQKVLRSQGKALKLLASPWSPPAWMKTNGQMDHSGSPCLRPDVHAAWALYFAKWIDAYKAHGIPIWAVTMQNEPENNATWEGCLYTPLEGTDFVATHLGPTLQAAHPEVLIFVFDHNKDTVHTWASATYSHMAAAQYVAGVAFHWYAGDHFEELRRIKQEFPQALLLPSEATWERWRWKIGSTLATGDWEFGEGYAHDIIGDLNTGSIGWIDWNLLLDERGGPNHVGNVCDATIMANLSSNELFFHPQYYYIGHFSKYILPESKNLETKVASTSRYTGKSKYQCSSADGPNCRGYGVCNGIDGLQATSFLRPDNYIVVVALNCGDDKIEFKLQFGPRAARTSIPGHSIQTYIFETVPSHVVVF